MVKCALNNACKLLACSRSDKIGAAAMRLRIIELQLSKSLLPDHVICTRALEKPDPVTIILSTTASSDSLIELLFSLTRTI